MPRNAKNAFETKKFIHAVDLKQAVISVLNERIFAKGEIFLIGKNLWNRHDLTIPRIYRTT